MYRIGIDLGGTNMKAGIVDENHKIVIQDSIPTRVEHPYKEIIRDMTELVKDLLKKIHITEEKLSGIGVGSPGTVDAKNGIVLYSNNFNWENIPLAEELGKYFACKIRISNDANFTSNSSHGIRSASLTQRLSGFMWSPIGWLKSRNECCNLSIGLYIVLAPLYLKSVRKLQEKRFVFVKILAIIIPENGAKVSKIKCFQFAQQTLSQDHRLSRWLVLPL